MAEETKFDIEEKIYVKTDVIARLFGLSARRIEQLTQDGILPKETVGKGRKYELVSTIQRYTKHISDKANGKAKTDTEATLKEQKLKAEVALKESQGELHRLRTEIASGRYVSVEEVKLDYGKFLLMFKKFALSLPSRVAGRLAGYVDPVEVRQIESDLQTEINKTLRDFVIKFEVAPVQQEKKRGRKKKDATK